MNSADQFETVKHTPGLWFEDEPGQIMSAATREYVANTNMESLPTSQQIGNARLIAAAPELLAALQEFVKYAVDCNDDSHELDKARAAIAKATGVPT